MSDVKINNESALTVGDLRQMLSRLPSETKVFIKVDYNDDTLYHPVEDIQDQFDPIILLCGEEVIMAEEDNGQITEVR
jgi:hypothetical protein